MQIAYEIRDAGLGIGNGIFTKEAISAGTLIWKFKSGVNVIEYDGEKAKQHLSKFAALQEAQNWLDLTYGLNGKLCEIIDDGKYMNHSETPNCKTDEKGDTYAIRKIAEGEQLFEDYTTFGNYK